MAKQSRGRPPARSTSTAKRKKATPRQHPPVHVAAPAHPSPPKKSYVEALDQYERGIKLLQHKDFAGALKSFDAVLQRFPEEKELHERVRLYVNICERNLERPSADPRTTEEFVYAATLALNRGDHATAIDRLTSVIDRVPDNDHALYMMAVARALGGDAAIAVSFLKRAIELNPENRSLARHEPDFEAIRANPEFRAVLESNGGHRPVDRGRRRPSAMSARAARR